MDKLTPEQRRRNMQSVKATGSKIEVLLAKKLWSMGLRYRKNDRRVVGKPDISFYGLKIAVFVDGEFWHGKNWEHRKLDHKSNQDFWFKKIERNMARDIEVNEALLKSGWKVLRFWGREITRDLQNCIDQIVLSINERKRDSKH